MKKDRNYMDILIENRRVILMCMAIVYLFIVLDITLIDRTVGARRHMLQPLWEVRQMLRSQQYSHWGMQIVGNCILLLPMGIFLPAMSEWFHSVRRTTAAAFLFSSFIELTQYVTGRGLCELDDIIHNTFGAAVGVMLYMGIVRLAAEKEYEY